MTTVSIAVSPEFIAWVKERVAADPEYGRRDAPEHRTHLTTLARDVHDVLPEEL